MPSLEQLLVQVRRIEAHRGKDAEKQIRKAHEKLLKELRHYLADEYTAYAEDDRLTYDILQRHGQYARFLEEVEQKINDISPETKRLIRSTVEQSYEATYNGMIDCVARVAAGLSVGNLKGVTADVVRRAVENPISKLTLNDRLEKHRREIIYDIKQNISVGLINGDRYSTMANRIKQSVDGDYKKAIRIARTETHRVREAGNHDAAMAVDEELKVGTSGMRMHKTWKTMKDERVRPAGKVRGKARKYDHRKMDGVSILMDEEFELPSGAKTMAPGQSGVAGEDINCRCYLSYGLQKVAENVKISLSDDEQWAVNSYVSFDAYPLNDALRNGRPLDANMNMMSDNLDTALRKLPRFEGNLNRSLDLSNEDALTYFDSLMVDGKIIFPEFISTTKQGIHNPDALVQIFIQNGKQGRDLGVFNEMEHEVLYQRNSVFKVVDKQQENGVYYILLEEE